MSASLIAPSRRRAQWHDLRISHLARLTDDAVAVTFDVPSEVRDVFAFEPGQYLTLRSQIEGQDVRRSYSICMSRGAFAQQGQVRVASARVASGAMSNWLNDHARIGQSVSVMPPMGDFTVPTVPDRARHHAALAAGSGITPVLSIITTALDEEPQSRVTLIFGNRSRESIMFRQELTALMQAYPDRFRLIHVLSQEKPSAGTMTGRIDRDRMHALIGSDLPVHDVDEWYICGPQPMVLGVQEVLAEHRVDPRHVHREIFHVEEDRS
ncbi:MAG: FAD-binding oxidoreductase [Ornithinimicrobium sp.]